MELRLADIGKQWKPWEKVVVLYVHDFVFRFICTLAGFLALAVVTSISQSTELAEISAGGAAVLSFAFLIAVVGIGGQLHYVILMGKVPKA